MDAKTFNWQVAHELNRYSECGNLQVVQWDSDGDWEVFKDNATNRYWSCPGDYWIVEALVEVFPTEITKVVYLPKELT